MTVSASSPDLSMGEEGLQADLDMVVGEDGSSHVGGAPATGDPPHCIKGVWLL
jgi:hypothetical protein